jgi:hypothetical protein
VLDFPYQKAVWWSEQGEEPICKIHVFSHPVLDKIFEVKCLSQLEKGICSFELYSMKINEGTLDLSGNRIKRLMLVMPLVPCVTK